MYHLNLPLAIRIALFLVFAPAPAARAGGFLVYDLSGEAAGKASAVAASTMEPAAVWFNPAGLAFMPGHAVSAGGIVVLSSTRFEPSGSGSTVKSEPGRFFLPTVFAAGEVTDWLHVGLGAYPAFGLGIEWPSSWVGREHAIKSEITTLSINPTVAFRIHQRVSLGVGFDVVRGVVDSTNALPAPAGGVVRVAGSGWGFGANAGLLVRAIPGRFHAALTYRSRVKVRFDGRADFDPRPEFARDMPDQGGRSGVTLPDIVTIGLMYRPIEALELAFDTNLVLWGTYDKTVLDFEKLPAVTMTHDYHAAVVLRAGADWATPLKGLNVRGGLIFDQTPAPGKYLGPSLPDGNQVDFTAGLGYTRGWFKGDLGYQFIWYLPSRSWSGREGPEGTYSTIAHFIAVTATAWFGR